MSLKSFAQAWNRFFFEPQSPIPIALFRIAFSLVVVIDVLLLRPAWQTWFGPRGLITLHSMQQMETGTRINVFAILPQTAFWTDAVFWVLLVGALLLAFGLFTRASSVLVYVLLASVHERNLYIANSADTLLRASAFFLMFAPAGAALSLDRLIKIWRGCEGLEIRPRAPWAQRMIQIELSLMYLMTFWNKSQGSAWIDGTALYYVYHLDQFRRFPMPGFLQDIFMVRLETWLTLVVEFALGVLVWFKELRYPVLLAGVVLHLMLEYTMNVPMFQWTALALYTTFLDDAGLARAWAWISSRNTSRLPHFVAAGYDPASLPSRRAATVLQAFDIFHRLQLFQRAETRPAEAAFIDGPRSIPRLVLAVWGLVKAPRSPHEAGPSPVQPVSARSGSLG